MNLPVLAGVAADASESAVQRGGRGRRTGPHRPSRPMP
jgi:hypothetical protein